MTSADTSFTAATPRRIWALRRQSLAALLAALALALPAPCFAFGLLRARSALLFGAPGHRLTHSQGKRPGERHLGVLFLFGYFLFEHAKRK